MPKLASTTATFAGTKFTYQAARIGDLGATEYTLVTIAIDMTGSVSGFEAELRAMLVAVIDACRRSPRSDNLLVRVLLFSSRWQDVSELHGFMPLVQIDPATYPAFQPGGMTPLYDATFNAIGATVDYGSDLSASDFLANGIVFVITDGSDNTSTATPAMVRQLLETTRRDERLESILAILIGVNATQYQGELDRFVREADLDGYRDAHDATPQNLAKLARFVSQSISSTSLALGTGGPSQTISATI